jgi:hypothetical protein
MIAIISRVKYFASFLSSLDVLGGCNGKLIVKRWLFIRSSGTGNLKPV